MTGAVVVGVGGDDVPADLDALRPPPECLASAGEVPAGWVLRAGGGPEGLPGQWVDAGLSAWFAESARVAWQQARWVLATSRAQAGTSERVVDRPRSAKVVATSLGWSEAYAGARVEFARQVLERLPALGEAMAAGVLEERKAQVFTTTLEDLDDVQARTVVDRLLDAAPGLAFGWLRLRVEQTAGSVDPGWAAARRAASVARRRVGFRIAPSGGAELAGLDLPEEAAQDAHDRIVALGRAALRRLKAAGHKVPVGPIESEVMLTLTGPAGVGMGDLEVVDHVVSCFTDPDDPAPGSGGPSDGGPDDAGPDGGGPDDDDPSGPDDGGPDDAGPGDGGPGDGGPGDGGSSDDVDCGGPDDSGPAGFEDDPSDELVDDADEPVESAESDSAVVGFVARTVLRVGLGTVLGLDQRPGVLPGRGVVTAPVARAMAWARTGGSWRVLVYDDDGALEHVLLVRPPHRGPPPVGGRRRQQVVEVTAHTGEVDTLHAAMTAARDPVGHHPGGQGELDLGGVAGGVVPGDSGVLIGRVVRGLAAARARPAGQHPAVSTGEVGNRFAGAGLRAWVQARDQTCRAPGCAADAVVCDLDHTRDWLSGGCTVAWELGAFCRRDHLFKHDPDTEPPRRVRRPVRLRRSGHVTSSPTAVPA